MAEINITNDLEQVNSQLEQLVAQLNKLNTDREQLTQQIHNLNGIAMYLRGKEEDSPNGVNEEPVVVGADFERTNEYPSEG